MKAKLLKSTQNYDYVQAKWNGINCSGYQPVGDHIMVLTDQASTKSAGGIEIPPELVDRMTMAAETGTIVGVGEDAFLWNGDRTRKWEGAKPKVGDQVYIQRFAGQLLRGEDDQFYRIMGANCIAAIRVAVPFAVVNSKAGAK